MKQSIVHDTCHVMQHMSLFVSLMLHFVIPGVAQIGCADLQEAALHAVPHPLLSWKLLKQLPSTELQ